MTRGRVRAREEARRRDAAAGRAGAPAPPRGRARAGGSTCARRCCAWRASRRRWRRAFTRPRRELPPLVVLLDISGSMERYARLLLHYVHGLTRRYLRVHTLTFGTRLTNITRALQHRDPDVGASRRPIAQVHDWNGGTRIASCLDEFNRRWARRLLGGSAALLLITDGLDRDEHGDLATLPRSCAAMRAQIVWLNPAAALRRLRAARGRRARAAAARRPLPAGAQPREPRRPRPGAARRAGTGVAPVAPRADGRALVAS